MSTKPLHRRAEQARSILENELFADTLAELDAALVARWRSENDREERDSIFYRQQALAEMRGSLLEHINKAAAQDAREGVTDSVWRLIWNRLQ